jgi:hypothetical protein
VIKPRRIREVGGGMEHGRERGKEHKRLWWGSLREGDHLKDLSFDGRLISKWVSKK